MRTSANPAEATSGAKVGRPRPSRPATREDAGARGAARTELGERGDGDAVVLLLSVPEAARALRLGRSKTYQLIAAGDLEVVHIGRCCRVPVESVEAYVERIRSG
jgi:excisionase family DNA binding protein